MSVSPAHTHTGSRGQPETLVQPDLFPGGPAVLHSPAAASPRSQGTSSSPAPPGQAHPRSRPPAAAEGWRLKVEENTSGLNYDVLVLVLLKSSTVKDQAHSAILLFWFIKAGKLAILLWCSVFPGSLTYLT